MTLKPNINYGPLSQLLKRRGGSPPARIVLSKTTLPPPPDAVPRSEWPMLARVVSRFRKDGERGVGDTIQSKLGVSGEWFKMAMQTLAGGCGCTARQAWLNARYPY